jgi:hypothetical protein
MQVPIADQALVAPEKIVRSLLVPEHSQYQRKAAFFFRFGVTGERSRSMFIHTKSSRSFPNRDERSRLLLVPCGAARAYYLASGYEQFIPTFHHCLSTRRKERPTIGCIDERDSVSRASIICTNSATLSCTLFVGCLACYLHRFSRPTAMIDLLSRKGIVLRSSRLRE